MKNKFLKGLVASFALAFSGLANAGLITSESDIALQGSNFIDFESFAVGFYNELDFDGGTFESFGAQYGVTDDWNSYNNNQGRSFANWDNYESFILRFDNDVSAFGLTIGAINSNWSFSLFDVNNVLIDSFSILNGCCDSRYIGFSANNIRYVQFTPEQDFAVFDSLSFVNADVQDVPEPSTIAIFALGLMGLASRKFKKEA